MARGVRFVREPDSPEACVAAFEAAFAVPTYGAEVYRWNAYVDGDLQLMFEGDVARVLGREQFVALHFGRMVARFGFRGTPERDARAWQGAGNAAGWGVRLGLLREDLTPAGEPGWRLVRGEPTWVVEDGQPVQIRG
ncbi:hypothetical protein ABEV34_19760, partial [Methylorubrum rhodesianum]|uniref:hypothetical protein n=1 Tax=Methylorubrum rhodesianum TaxID=29427 RepID=UPI003D26662B